MVGLFESKLNSLPDEIKNTFPDLTIEKLDDLNNLIIQDNTNTEQRQIDTNTIQNSNPNSNKLENILNPTDNNNSNNNENQNNNDNNIGTNTSNSKLNQKLDEIKEEEVEKVKELTPQEIIDNFLKENPQCERVYKAMNRKIPSNTLIPQARLAGVSESTVKELIELYKKIDPSYY